MNIRRSFCAMGILAFAFAFMVEARADDAFADSQQLRAPLFSISTASNFRTALKGIRPAKITGSSVTYEPMPFAPVVGTMPSSTTAPVMGTVASNPYATLQGVVVSIVQPVDPATGSRLDKIQLMDYTPAFRANLAANNPQTSAHCYVTKTQKFVLTKVLFKGLPSGRHIYSVSVGTDIPKDYLMLQDFYSQATLSGAQLVSNSSTAEVMGLFSLEQSTFTVQVLVNPTPNWWYNFHHVQMTCLDCQ